MLKKPLNRKNYGSVPHLSNSKLGPGDHYIDLGQEKILTSKTRDKKDVVFAFEKYDGCNVGIARKDDQIYGLTRNGFNISSSNYKQHILFDQWVKKRKDMFMSLLKDGERLVAEWMTLAHGIKYKVTGEPIVFFDFFDPLNKRYSYNILEQMDLPLARLLHKGNAASVDDLLPILNQKTPHVLSEDDPEGMVFRVERDEVFDFMAKWVRSSHQAGKYIKKEKEVWNELF